MSIKMNDAKSIVERMEGVVEKRECEYDTMLLTSFNELAAKPYLANGRHIVQIDTLRNSTSITVALAAGAAGVSLYGKRDEGLEHLRRDAALHLGSKVLAGEVEGQPIPGFTMGNSPREFTSDAVRGRHIFYSSTNNGSALTYLMSNCDPLGVYWACLLNATAVGEAIGRGAIGRPLLFLCAGFRGTLALEDVVCAGAIMMSARSHGRDLGRCDDGTTAAKIMAQNYYDDGGKLSREKELIADMLGWRCGRVLDLMGQSHDVRTTVNGEGIEAELVKRTRTCIPILHRGVNPPSIRRHIIEN